MQSTLKKSVPAETSTPSSVKRNVIAVIPAYNEEKTVGSVVTLARRHVSHVIVVDDGSEDRTAEIARAAGAQVIQQANKGYGGAIQAGFAAALSTDAEYVILLDADMQHEPAEIPNFIEKLKQGEADVVIGNRFIHEETDVPAFRRFGQSAFTAVGNLTGGAKIADSQNGFRAFTRRALKALNVRSNGMGFASEMLYAIKEADLRLEEVATKINYTDAPKRNIVAHGIEVMNALVSVFARKRPILLMGLPGVILFAVGTLIGLHVVRTMGATGVLPTGLAILTNLLLIVGAMLATTSIMLQSFNLFITRFKEEIADLLKENR